MLGNFIFDIDGAMAIAVDNKPEEVEKDVKKKFGEVFFKKYCLVAYNYPHYIFPGYYALFKWLNSKGGKLFFFSSGIKERNVELARKMMEMSFKDSVSSIPYKVFSREDCIDTNYYLRQWEEGQEEKYQSFFYGRRKKKLAGIVVPEEELSNSLLIDDDTSYMVKGEEYNFIAVRYSYKYILAGASESARNFILFHKAYYLAGIFQTIFDYAAKNNVSLSAAAKFVQIDSEKSVLSRDFYFPSRNRTEYHLKGRKILNQIDPTLDFYFDVPQEGLSIR